MSSHAVAETDGNAWSGGKSPFGVSYGKVTTHTHSGDHISGGNTIPFPTELEATEYFNNQVNDAKSKGTVSVVKTLKLYNF